MAKEKSDSTPVASKPAKLSRVQKFTMERVNRTQLKGASFNPRVIDAYTKKKLEKVLRTQGLVQPIVWNRRSQNVVGGHQRLDCIDQIEGQPNYLLDVAVVDLDPAKEREVNLMLNNSSLTGDWDFAKLAEMSKFEGFEFDAAGFDKVTVEGMFAGTEFGETMFSPEAQAPEVTDAMGALAEIADSKPKSDPKARRAEMKAEHKVNENADLETYVVVVCKSREECEAIAKFFDSKPGDKYIDGQRVFSKCGIDVPKLTEIT